MQRDVLSFFAGVFVGIVGNLFVSTVIEMSKAVFEKSNVLWYWAIMFIVSSIVTFQLIRWSMNNLGIAQRELRSLDYATIILVLVGIFVLVWDKFLRP